MKFSNIFRFIWRIIVIVSFILLILMILVFLTYIYVAYLSPEAIRGHTNYDNSQKIRPFMSKEEVISIMGIPDTMYHNVMRPGYPKSYDLIYTPPFGASDDVRIWIDSTDHVIEVLPMD